MYSIFRARRAEEDWRQERGFVLFTWSIINPNGPTLSCVGVRDSGSPRQLEVFYRWLHFYGGESFILGYVSEDSADVKADILEILRYAFAQDENRAMQRFPMVTCIPSFVTLPNEQGDTQLINADDIRDLFAGSRVFREADWGREMYYLRKYGSLFFDRAGEETREALETAALDPAITEQGRQRLEIIRIARGSIPSFRDWAPNQYTTRAMQQGDFGEWWSVVAGDEFVVSSLQSLANAWVGAIHQVSSSAVTPVESFELVKEFLKFHKCGLWPEHWTSSLLRESMGLSD